LVGDLMATGRSAVDQLLPELGRTQEALAAQDRALDTADRIEDETERELVSAELRINQARVYQRLDMGGPKVQRLRCV